MFNNIIYILQIRKNIGDTTPNRSVESQNVNISTHELYISGYKERMRKLRTYTKQYQLCNKAMKYGEIGRSANQQLWHWIYTFSCRCSIWVWSYTTGENRTNGLHKLKEIKSTEIPRLDSVLQHGYGGYGSREHNTSGEFVLFILRHRIWISASRNPSAKSHLMLSSYLCKFKRYPIYKFLNEI